MKREPKDPLVEIAELAEELCDPREHVERLYEWTKSRNRKIAKKVTSVQPGLLEQLRDAIRGATVIDEVGRRSVPDSRPPLLLEALARHLEIITGANEWISHVRETHRGDLESNVRALVGAAASLDRAERFGLLRDLRRWRSWAAVMSGWANPALQPHVRCPNPDCATMGSLRVNPERKRGFCVECRQIWDDRDGSINVLAAYIKGENAKPRGKVPVRSTTQGNGGWADRRKPTPEVRVEFPDWVQ